MFFKLVFTNKYICYSKKQRIPQLVQSLKKREKNTYHIDPNAKKFHILIYYN